MHVIPRMEVECGLAFWELQLPLCSLVLILFLWRSLKLETVCDLLHVVVSHVPHPLQACSSSGCCVLVYGWWVLWWTWSKSSHLFSCLPLSEELFGPQVSNCYRPRIILQTKWTLFPIGNLLVVPIIKLIGLTMGLTVWGVTNMLAGWFTGVWVHSPHTPPYYCRWLITGSYSARKLIALVSTMEGWLWLLWGELI